MTVQAFVDESKVDGLLVCVAVTGPPTMSASRAALRGLLLPGQRRLHFTKERDERRRKILATICRQAGLSVDVYDARAYGVAEERRARAASLRAVVNDLATQRASRLVIERDESVAAHDRRTLYDATRRAGVHDTLTYELLAPHEEPLLWVADAAAWSWVKGGDWRRRISPVIRNVTLV